MEEVLNSMEQGSKGLTTSLKLLESCLEEKQIRSSDPNAIAVLADYKMFLRSRNAKVLQTALRCLGELCVTIGPGSIAHVTTIIPQIIERLGDLKQKVRTQANEALLAIMTASGTSTEVLQSFEKPLESYKAPLVKEGLLAVASKGVEKYPLDKKVAEMLVPHSVRLLEDGSSEVRDAAMRAICSMYIRSNTHVRAILNTLQIKPKTRSTIKKLFSEIKVPMSKRSSAKSSSSSSTQSRIRKHRRQSSSRKISPNTQGDTTKANQQTVSDTDINTASIPNGVEVVSVYTEKELSEEMDMILSTLSDVRNKDWNERIKALNRLGGLVMGGAHDLDNFSPLFLKLKNSLVEQLQDLRSSVVKHTCAILSYISCIIRNRMEPIMEFVIPVLSRLNCVKIQVMSESANRCMNCLLRNTRCPRRAVQKIFDMGTAKAPAVREKSLDYLTILLRHSPTDLTKRLSTVEELLKPRLTDASGPVRAAARQCFKALAVRWPSRAEYLAADLDPKIKRLLDESEIKSSSIKPPKSFSSHRHAASLDLHTSNVPITRRQKNATNPQMKLASSPKRVTTTGGTWPTPSRTSDSTAETAGKLRKSPGSTIQRMDRATKKKGTSSPRHIKHAATWNKEDTNSGARSSSPINARNDTKSKVPQKRNNNPQVGLGGAQRAPLRHVKSTVSLHKKQVTTKTALGGGASRVSVNTELNLDVDAETKAHVMRKLSPKASSARRKQQRSTVIRKASMPNLHSHADTTNTVSSHPNAKLASPSNIKTSKSLGGSTESTGAAGNSNPAAAVKRWIEYALQANDWAEKVRCFSGLGEALLNAHSSGLHLPSRHAGSLVKLFEGRLADPHQKVAVTTLSCFVAMTRCLAGDIVPYLDRLLVKLLPRVQDSRLAIRRAAGVGFESLLDEVGAQVLPSLVRVAGSRGPQARSAAMDTLARLTSSFPAFFRIPGNMKSSVSAATRCLRQARPGANPLKIPAINLLAALYNRFTPQFVFIVNSAASETDQGLLINTLHKKLPDLKAHLANPASVVEVVEDAVVVKTTDATAADLHNGEGSVWKQNSASIRNDEKLDGTNFGKDRKINKRRFAWGKEGEENVETEAEHAANGELKNGATMLRDQHQSGDEDMDDTKKSHLPLESLQADNQGGSERKGFQQLNREKNVGNVDNKDGVREVSSPFQHQLHNDKENEDGNRHHSRQSASINQHFVISTAAVKEAEEILKMDEGNSKAKEQPPSPPLIKAEVNGKQSASATTTTRYQQQQRKTRTYGGVTVDVILAKLGADERKSRLEAIETLAWLSRQSGSIWEGDEFDNLFLGLLESCENDDSGVVAVALTVIVTILKKFPRRFSDYVHIELLTLSLLETLRDPKHPLQPALRLVEQALDLVSTTAIPDNMFAIFVTRVDTELSSGNNARPPSQRGIIMIRISLKCLATLMLRMEKLQLAEYIDRITPPLVKCLNHANVMVRQSVIQCFVAMHAVAGPSYMEHLSGLKDSQRRLIKIYVEKTAKARQSRSGRVQNKSTN